MRSGAAIVLATMTAAHASPPSPGENIVVALRVLQLREPNVAWHSPGLRGDFTGDGVPDLAVAGHGAEMFQVAVMEGPVSGGSRMARLFWRAGGDDLEPPCLRAAGIVLEELALPPGLEADESREMEDARARGVKGLRLEAPPCDPLHLYWNRRTRSLSWWR